MLRFAAATVLVWCALCPPVAATGAQQHSDVHARQRRYLVFTPYTHFIELILGFGLPITVGQHSLTLGPSLKYIYQLPYNGSQFTQPYVVSAKREVGYLASRWLWYSVLEQALDRFGLDGRACLLRTICESAEAPVRNDDIPAELLHIFLTPSTSDEAADGSSREYLSAERVGSAQHAGCGALYQECGVSLLDFVSELGVPV